MSEAEVGAAMEVARARGLRVCAHCRSGDSVRMARTVAYDAVNQIRFEGMQYRSDIGHRAVKKT